MAGEPTAEQLLDAELKKEAFLKSGFGYQPSDTVKIIEAFSSDKNESDKKRPGFFNRHSLFGDIKKAEQYAQIFYMKAMENYRSMYRSAMANNAAAHIDSNEMITAYLGFSSRSLDGKERNLLGKTITEIITNKSEQPKKGGLGRLIPFRGRG